ncbi:heme ABC transporter permease [Pokkaliibacter sp. CJK22405]|uniref:heme ABC transporter permease n=1 Tax=Pokkaliibacter sp. CJK22405 TaxID=3384615 RepID=UPI00398463F4
MAKKQRMPTWFYQLGSPRWFYQMTGRWSGGLALLAAVLLIVGTVWGLLFAPADYQQGNSFRIIYIHVPSAFLAESAYMLLAAAGLVALVWRMKMAEVVMKCAAPIGASFAAMALITGAIWGRPTWGAWWVWDARITSMLILLFLYLGIIALHAAINDRQMAARAAAILALVGVVNIPIIKYSVDWWNTLHQPATFTLTKKPDMPPSMWVPLLVMVLGLYCFFGWALIKRCQTEILIRERKSVWVIELLTGKAARSHSDKTSGRKANA